ncbi:MAG: enoyl-CoA hydratase/isomerase family protein, partial [Deltaproteobacteria bacterium]|nr:enoyl-CoA hydratase/isomerase family protein [Deltaproteobacteria bacterium]
MEEYAKTHPKFPVPECLKKQAAKGQAWHINHLQRHDIDGVAWIRIRRPKVLNALNQQVFNQLKTEFEAIEKDDSIKAAVLSGFGTKAFVSGADINFLAKIETAQQGFETTQESKQAGAVIENLGKPVVCALNGFALGGGLELAMSCTTIIVKQGLK